jgi:hypothetical protein
MMQAKNPKFVNAGKTLIDLIVTHPIFGEIPFTASPDDVEDHGRDLFARAVAGEFGPVADYVPPPPPPEPVKPQTTEANPVESAEGGTASAPA